MVTKMKISYTTLCYIEKDGCYLMMHRTKKKNDENHDKWIGIGGHFEDGETPLACILRECFEETGLTLTDAAYRGLVTFVQKDDSGEKESVCEYMHLFTATEFTGEMTADCAEGELVWLPKDALYQKNLWEGDRVFLRLLDENAPFFSLKLVYDGNGVLQKQQCDFVKTKRPLLISACLMGLPCRFDGQCKGLSDAALAALAKRYTLIPVCPEQLGGLPTPRPPAEICGGVVRTKEGVSVDRQYRLGAENALRIAKAAGADTALLKFRSPSCGKGSVHNGLFDGGLTDGNGITAQLLLENGFAVFSENEWEMLL